MPKVPQSTWVFISHSSQDRDVADALCRAIEHRGLTCWIAIRDIRPSEGFQDSIVQAIEQSRAMVLVFTQNANNSQEIKKEIALAGQYSVPVIPVRVEDVLPSGGFRYELATRQWIDLFNDWEGAVEQIVEKVGKLNDGEITSTQVSTTASRSGPLQARARQYSRSRRRLSLMAAGLVIAAALWLGVGHFDIFAFAKRDPPAEFPEMPGTRLSSFTFQTSPNEYKAGSREWTRVAPDRWVEMYPDGSKEFASSIGRTQVGECDGSIVSSDPTRRFQVFLPDRSCQVMRLLFRRLPDRNWISWVQMENVR